MDPFSRKYIRRCSDSPESLERCSSSSNSSSGRLSCFTVGQTLPKCFISEVSSPTRFYFQLAGNPDYQKLLDMRNFYEQKVIKERSTQFDLDESELRQPLKRIVALYGNYSFDRAIVISGRITKKKSVKVFFYDYGTVVHMNLSSCKRLIENYEDIPPLAHRAALHGIEPSPESGIKLWPVVATSDLAAKLLDKEVKIKIMKHHVEHDFYEVKVELDSQDLSELLIEEGVAIKSQDRDVWNNEIVVNCIKYPPFEFIENTDFYPTAEERNFLIREECIDFNEFEEYAVKMSICDIESVEAQKRELKKAFKDGFAKGENSEVEEGFNSILEGYHCALHHGG